MTRSKILSNGFHPILPMLSRRLEFLTLFRVLLIKTQRLCILHPRYSPEHPLDQTLPKSAFSSHACPREGAWLSLGGCGLLQAAAAQTASCATS